MNAYELYSKKGYFARTTPEIGLASACDACLTFFKKFETAVAVKNPIVFEDYRKRLPISILNPTILSGEYDVLNGLSTIGEFLESKKNTTIKVENNSARITVEHVGGTRPESEIYIINEMLQADFSGKGNVEVLLFVYCRSPGTLHFSYPCLAGLQAGQWSIDERL